MTTARRPVRTAPAALLAALALLLAPAAVRAQRCLGFPGFAGQPLRLDGVLTTGDNVTTLGADLAFGQAAGVFGSVGLGVADYDRVNHSALLVSGSIGTQVTVGTPSRTSAGAQLCPVAALEYRAGPNVGDVDQNGLAVRGGVSLGTSLPMTTSVRFAPFGTVSLAYQRASVDTPRGSASSSDVGGIFDLGGGFIFTERFTVRPSVAIPVGFEGADPRFGLAIGFSFGGR